MKGFGMLRDLWWMILNYVLCVKDILTYDSYEKDPLRLHPI